MSVTARSAATSQRRLGELSEVCAKATCFATDPTTILATSPVRIENVEVSN